MASRSPGPESKPKGRGRGRGRSTGRQPTRSPGSESREDGGVPHQRLEDCIFVGDLVVYKKQRLGGGAFGYVFKGTFGGQPCAVKVLHQLATQLTSPFPTAGATQDEDLARFEKECRLLEKYNHRNIVRHMGTVIEPESNLPVLVMELMDENLTKFLRQPGSEPSTLLSFQLQISLSCDIACGLQYLHSNNIVHQDLCSDNVLLKHEGSRLIAKVSDFGISRIVDPDNLTRSLRTVSHRDAYMPPKAETSASSIYDTSLDIFSFGVVAVQVVMKVPTVAHPRDRDSLVQKIESSHPLRELIVYCLHKNKEKRPKTSEVYRYLNELLNAGEEKLKDIQLFQHVKALVPLEESKVTVEVSSLPPQTNTDELEAYFEKQGNHIEVLSTVNLGNGNAKVELSGLTSEELETLQKKQHKIKEQLVHMKVSVDNVATIPELPPQPSILLDTLEVSGLPPAADTELLKLYFESPRSGSHSGAVEKCSIVVPGTAHIKFQSSEVAVQVLSVPEHTICKAKVQLQYAQVLDLEKPAEQYESNKLLVHQIPQVDEDYLQLFFENTLQMDPQNDFIVEVRNGSAMVTFLKAQFSYEDLVEMTSKIGSKPLKGVILQAELCKVLNSIRVRGVTKNYTEDYFQLYFETPKQSGGGKVTSITLLGNGEAIVAFQDPRVVESVLCRTHTSFGEKAVVEREDPFRTVPLATLPPTEHTSDLPTTNDGNPHHPVVIPIDPLVAKSLQKDPRGLRECVQSLNVDIFIDEKNKLLLITPTTHTIAGWKQEVEQLAPSYISSKYKTLEITFPKEATNELKQCLVSLEEETSLVSELSQESLLLKAAGDPTAISMLQTRADEICSAYVQTSEKVELTEEDYDFFAQVKAPQCTSVHTDVSIQYDFSNHAIILQGSVRSVAHFRQILPEYLFHGSVMVQLDPLIIHYLSTDNGRQQLNDFIQNKKCPVAVHFPQVPPSSQLVLLFLCDPSQTSLTSSISRDLQEETSTKSQPLKDTFAQRLSEYEEEYQQLCQDLQTQHRVKILTSDNIVTVAGFNKDVGKSIQSIDEFVLEKCNVTSSIEIKRGIWRLFCGPMQRKWQNNIVTKCKQNGIELTEPDEGDDRMVILVKGDATIVAEICQEIHDIENSVISEPVSISRPGTCKYFHENEQAGTLLAGIEKTENVCIEKSEIDDSMIDDEISDPGNSPGATKFTKVCMARTQEMKQILLYVGDITEFDKADVIVNAANGDLQHVGGVAGAIADKGGPIIQQESSQYVRRCGRLDDGDVWLTTKVGALPCKALIHAVGPRWSGGHSKEEALLSKACTQSLQKACKYRSIAFPAISSGIYGFPMDRCADTLVGAAVTFCEKNSLSELQEIYFVVFKQNDAQAFVKALEARLPQDNIFVSSLGKSTHPMSNPPYAPIPGVKTATRKKAKKAVATHQDGIILKQGSLTDVKADVYVNTTNVDLNLSQGAVAQALSKAAGPALQAECTKKAPISVGDIAVTGGGRLPCRYVLHTVAAQYHRREKPAEKELRMLVNKCLKECTKLRVTSIAFPAIGTGNLGYPNDVVARVMVEAVSSFLSSHKSSTLKAVYLVIFMTDTYHAFQQELTKQRLTPETSYVPSTTLPQERDTPRRSSQKHSSRHVAATAFPQSIPNQQTFQLGTIRVQVLNGDITDDSSDAVVNPTNSGIQLAGPGVSGALLRKGGEELQRECNKLTSQGLRLEEGKVLHTPATGALKCKYVFHILFESKDQKKFLKTITACLHKAEELKCNSIAFPAIGTGAHGYSPDAAAKGMMKAIDQFATSKVTNITLARVVLFQQDVYQAFVAVFNDPESLSRPGFWQRTKEFVGSFLPWPGSTEDDGNLATSHPTSLSYEQMMYRDIELVIYGETQGAVQRAVERLLRMIDEQFITDTVDDPNVDKLTQSEIDNLEDTSKQLHVEININPAPLNLIRLKGDKANVHKIKCYVIETLAELEKRILRQREAENMQKLVQWKRMDSQETPYDMAENYEIELAYKAQKPLYRHHTTAENYTVDFNTMEEIDHNNMDRFPVVRVDLIKKYQEGIEKPAHWDPMPTDPQTGKEVTLHCVDLTPGSKEYKKILQEFNKTLTMTPTAVPAAMQAVATTGFYQPAVPHYYQPANTYNGIVRIQRIQNPMLYSQYIVKKKDMDKHNPPGHQNEWRLFHGTPADVCPKINQQGFNRSFAGKNATMHGRGVYFAHDASYSARSTYSPPDVNGERYIYLARVLVGEFTVGNSGMLVPPPKHPQDPTILFDSVVDNTSNPGIFVIFYDSQAYPEYLIVFN